MLKDEVLESFGLTKAEVKAYLSLLSKGESTASALARATGSNRTFTYDRLKKLIGKGLVTYVSSGGKTRFIAAKPGHLVSVLKEKEARLRSILPELERLASSNPSPAHVEVFSGSGGIRSALNRLLKEKEILVNGSLQPLRDIPGNYLDIWNRRRVESKIKLKILSPKVEQYPLAQADLLESESDSTIFISKSIVVILLWSSALVAILLSSREIAANYAAVFNSLWNREFKVYHGSEGIVKAWTGLVEERPKEIAAYGLSWDFARVYGRDASDTWHKLRLKNRVALKFVSYADEKSRKYFALRTMEWPSFEIKYLDKTIVGPACIAMTPKTIVTFLYTERNLSALVMKNREMIEIYRKHFEVLWEKSR